MKESIKWIFKLALAIALSMLLVEGFKKLRDMWNARQVASAAAAAQAANANDQGNATGGVE